MQKITVQTAAGSAVIKIGDELSLSGKNSDGRLFVPAARMRVVGLTDFQIVGSRIDVYAPGFGIFAHDGKCLYGNFYPLDLEAVARQQNKPKMQSLNSLAVSGNPSRYFTTLPGIENDAQRDEFLAQLKKFGFHRPGLAQAFLRVVDGL